MATQAETMSAAVQITYKTSTFSSYRLQAWAATIFHLYYTNSMKLSIYNETTISGSRLVI